MSYNWGKCVKTQELSVYIVNESNIALNAINQINEYFSYYYIVIIKFKMFSNLLIFFGN